MVDETEIELRTIQLEAAKLDLEAKRSDLKRRPSDLRNALTDPAAVAATIAAIVTVTTTIVSSIVTDHQTTKLATGVLRIQMRPKPSGDGCRHSRRCRNRQQAACGATHTVAAAYAVGSRYLKRRVENG